IPFDHDAVVESHPPDNPINAEHARQVDSCARSQDPTDLAGSVAAVETAETAETAETDGSVLRFTSESSVEATGSTDQETRRSRRSRRVQEPTSAVRWDLGETPPFLALIRTAEPAPLRSGRRLGLGVLVDHSANVRLALDLALLGRLDDLFVLFLGDDGNLLTVAVDDLAVLDRVTLGEDGLMVDAALQLLHADDSAGARDEDRAIGPILRPRTDVVEQKVEQHGHDRGRGDPGVEDDADPRGEGLVEVGLDDRDDAEGQRDRDDDHVEVALV